LFSVSKPLVFVSYSRKDSEKVGELRKRLEASGYRIWFDKKDIGGGEWRTAIKRGLRHSNRFLACISTNTVERGEVLQYEWDTALGIQSENLEGEVYLLPVRLEACELPEALRHLQCFDLYEADGWKRLSGALPKQPSKLPLAGLLIFAVLLSAFFVQGILFKSNPTAEFVEARGLGRSAAVSKTVRLGLTLWKMQPSDENDPPSVREIVHPAASAPASEKSVTPMRLDPAATFNLGDDFQLTVESSRAGLLYVIDRPLLDGASPGPATVIFPTARIRGGDNRIWPGALIRLPARDDSPPYWQLESKRPAYAGEQMIVLLTQQPLASISDDGAISDEVLSKWIEQWGKNVRSLVTDPPPPKLTVAEAAARDSGAQLSPSAPLPSVLFEAERAPDAPVLLVYSIPVKRR
jgi:hypothetical protein